ncbi:hypothetical protein BBI01_17825 [Chryseobacterium artocarpi]|uniref:Metalloprotease n=1 Tax=Chryseobacterium artocarpi TaxID=1414727 RepID=A0A1B8ZBT0_9FLAO|nr:T9SS-dependent M36 family metallopeptidase [Chryseobacterium artocarpi]OCA69071.1 hypothetical protein BBI01_17825 [Chryseobacterium artocarpi]
MKVNNYLTVKFAAVVFFNFSILANAQETEKNIIADYLNQHPQTNKVQVNKAETFKILDIQNDKALNGKVVNINQTYNDIPVYGAIASVIIKNNEVAYISDNFISADATKVKIKSAVYDIKSNFDKILTAAGLKSDTSKYTFDKKHHNSVEVQKAYFSENGVLILVDVLNFYEDGTNNYWNIVVDAETGSLVNKSNLTVFCKFDNDAYSHEHSSFYKVSNEATLPNIYKKKFTTSEKKLDGASYRVFALPIEAPTYGERTLEVDPWYSDASPLGWHDDGENNYTITRGNNVYTYADETGNNIPSGVSDGGNEHVFDFPLIDNNIPADYKDASITNLFYMNNKMHDIAYRFGFDEAGRNFQSNNFGKGEEFTDSDPVLAEARDGGGYNNANFSTPIDGYAPRMQMYLWLSRNYLTYNSPSELIPRAPLTGTNTDFGSTLTSTPITSDVVLANPIDACTDLTNTDVSGKIVLIQRGTCSFDFKYKKAQDKGAAAVIIYNTSPTQAFGDMVGTGITVSIPGVLVDYTEGQIIKSKLDQNINVNISLQNRIRTLDGSLDNGIIAHEYTHGISNRSTGNGYSCLNPFYANEQMGEGWSDFLALILTNKADATASQPRGLGTYVSNQLTTEGGIRPAKYSPDFNINSFTYGDTNGMAYDVGDGTYALDVHSIGFVWATMLWDLQWKFAEKYGFSNDIANNPESGSAMITQLVLTALKIQGCYPSFIKGRDAIIAADASINGGANKCLIWDTFAKRGLGVNAKSGKTAGSGNGLLPAISDQIEDFSIPTDCQLMATDENSSSNHAVSLYPNPAGNEFRIKANVPKGVKAKISIYDFSGKKITEDFIDVNADIINTSKLQNGIYIVKGDGIGFSFSKKLVIRK